MKKLLTTLVAVTVLAFCIPVLAQDAKAPAPEKPKKVCPLKKLKDKCKKKETKKEEPKK